uniref:Lipoprotein n=1 Tax=uncultured Alphaproteobacteria bacterium TaxID=91750 RepID=A0A6G8F3E1_9PROT|nr:hypothetical protein PlAlph_6040 [uncultured Alphaproteobacteria bacterium]
MFSFYRCISTIVITLSLCSCAGISWTTKSQKTLPVKDIIYSTPLNQELKEFFAPYINYDYFTEANVRKQLGNPIKEETTTDGKSLFYDNPNTYSITNFWVLIPYDDHRGSIPYSLTFEHDRLKKVSYPLLKRRDLMLIFGIPAWPSNIEILNPFVINIAHHDDDELSDKVDIVFNNLRYTRTTRLETNQYSPLFGIKYLKRTARELDKTLNDVIKTDTVVILEYDSQIISFPHMAALNAVKEKITVDYKIVSENPYNTPEMNCHILNLKQTGNFQKTLTTNKAAALCFVNKRPGIIFLSVENKNKDNSFQELNNLLRAISFRK